mmetsp:Transcript_25087/g.34412  ORF Transcript_25087/g.34412 Transcript_25087/m.34412 type:complete len:510 (-) Transcript_25087:115-1644(-)|eukprot:CAMPEP_0185773422 /NCGR_PEP_ID=MMETSP1174-20130828/73483_1 /TAXON_ID=35687 /ORGANISM="Dictyocha speculum, Strain CCMP1381" /LENGTH=509 /DNA_ID=CAMNT_0028460101 /DNA_START=109 /DNA_END=1638 /DNA_ORIENTATION=+
MTAIEIPGVDPVWLAMSRMRQRKFESCVETCDKILVANQRDQAALFLKCRALTWENYTHEADMEEEGVAELLLDDNATASMPRPGTSLSRPQSNQKGGADQSIRPVTSSGRPLTGFVRPGTGSRPVTGEMTVETAFKGSRPGTSRPSTMLGREVRLATASITMDGGDFSDVIARLNLSRLARSPALSMAIAEYFIYKEANPRRALELGAECTSQAGFKDWWWKSTLGKCYYKLGLFREAEKQFKSSIKDQDMVVTQLELSNVYIRLDLPKTALENLSKASLTHVGEIRLLLASARIHDMLNEPDTAVDLYKRVLALDPSNIESIACLAANHFYNDQPEISLRLYRRLLQMGVKTGEIWNNLGLCCFYSSQYDMALSCFSRSLDLSDDRNSADIWYNVGHVALGIGDASLSYQAFRIALSCDPSHAESFCNLGVLELRKNNADAAQANFSSAQKFAPYLFEPFFNGALLAYRIGNFEDSFSLVSNALELYPVHSDSGELIKTLKKVLTVL